VQEIPHSWSLGQQTHGPTTVAMTSGDKIATATTVAQEALAQA
jgi:hypothetical protein